MKRKEAVQDLATVAPVVDRGTPGKATYERNCGAKSNFPTCNRFSKVLCNLASLY